MRAQVTIITQPLVLDTGVVEVPSTQPFLQVLGYPSKPLLTMPDDSDA